ncbi:hypothetical protein B0H11DRAFT_2269087 [Mycena galericulata]|nr:hypothetical protein B0H11DRAFT_2269087 [Mycena galericulata]
MPTPHTPVAARCIMHVDMGSDFLRPSFEPLPSVHGFARACRSLLRLCECQYSIYRANATSAALELSESLLPFPDMGQVGLLDLPTELLVNIFENPTFPTATLYALAFLCRRLHFIALPIYIARSGMDYTTNSVVITMATDCWDLLGALQKSLIFPEIENITCIFPHPSCTSIFPILFHLRRLQSFVSRLHSLKQVTLELDTAWNVCLSRVKNNVGLRAWAAQLEALLNIIVARGCTSLTMIYGAHFTQSVALDSTENPRGPVSGLRARIDRLLHRGEIRTVEIGVGINLPSALARSSRLSSLNIQSAILIRPPGLQWTLAALQKCNITSLTLCHNVADADTWGTVLPLLASAAPGLTSVVLLDAQYVHDADLLTFLSRLPFLTHLTIWSTGTVIASQTWGVPTIDFRHLESLEAPPSFLNYFLMDRSRFTCIKSICIAWPAMGLDFYSGVSVAGVALIIDTIEAYGLAPRLSVVVDMVKTWGQRSQAPPPSDVLACLQQIECLKIKSANLHSPDFADIVAWIAMFPCIRRLEIDSGKLSVALPQGRVSRFVRTTKGAASLDSIVVNGTVYDL